MKAARWVALVVGMMGCGAAWAQTEAVPAVQKDAGCAGGGICNDIGDKKNAVGEAGDPGRPLPDIPALMHAVEANERTSEAVQKDYMFTSLVTEEDSDGHGGVKKTETSERDVFWVGGVEVERLTKKNGRPLSDEDQKKENERVDKEVSKGKERRAKAEAEGKESGPHGEDVVTVSRLLELGSFTNARRVQINGRDTIAVDFSGDPKAKTRNRFEEVIRDMAGTVWIDEQDRTLVKVQGHFVKAFKVGGGMLGSVRAGTNFAGEWKKVNDEVWLPASFKGEGEARALLLFKFDGSLTVEESNYRKFKTKSTILPGVGTVEEEPEKPQ